MENAARSDSARYDDWIEEELSGKPARARAFLRCVYETGVDVLDRIDGVPRSSLSLFAYLPGEYMQLYRKYEALIMTAAADPDTFVHGLHKKLTEICRYIRKNSRYPELFGLYSEISKDRMDFSSGGLETRKNAAFAYERLLLATYDCLAPEEYDDPSLLCGRSTGRELLYCERTCPYAGEIQRSALRARLELDDSGHMPSLDPVVRKYAAEYGCPDIRTFADLSLARAADAFHREQAANLSPFINEYTYDILPDRGHRYRMDSRALEAIIRQPLRDQDPDSRTGALPANGFRFDFAYDPRVPEGNRLQSLLMKETAHKGHTVMLYRFRFSGQDICGYHDLGDQMFYSPFETYDNSRDYLIAQNILWIVPYLYEAVVGPDGGRMIQGFGERFHAAAGPGDETGYPVSVIPHPLGGEPRNTYKDRGGPAGSPDDGDCGRPG